MDTTTNKTHININDFLAGFKDELVAYEERRYQERLSEIDDQLISEDEAMGWVENFINPIAQLISDGRVTPKRDGADGMNLDITNEQYYTNFIPDNDEVHLWLKGSYATSGVDNDDRKLIEEDLNSNIGHILRTLRGCGYFFQENMRNEKEECIKHFLYQNLLKIGFSKDNLDVDDLIS